MKELLIEDLTKEPSSYITSKWIVERVPFVFNKDLDAYIDWKERLSLLIEVDSKSIVLTGSSAVGFSLNPEKNLKAFDDKSDVDVAVISPHYFDVSWHFLRNIGTRIYKLNPKEKNAIADHRQRLIYWGIIATDKILHILPFGLKWEKALSEMRKVKPTEDREINLRIYKDFEALRAYQIDGINKIKDNLLKN